MGFMDKLRKFSLTDGIRRTSMVLGGFWFRPGYTPGWSEWDYTRAIMDGYKKNPILFSVLDNIIRPMNGVIWAIKTKGADGEWKPNGQHQANALLLNPFPNISWISMLERGSIDMDLGGNWIWYKIRNPQGQVIRWQPLDITRTRPVRGDLGAVEYYEYINFIHDPVRIETSELIHCMRYNPADPAWGLSKLQVLARTVDTDNSAQDWNKIMLDNRGVAEGVWETEYPFKDEQEFKDAQKMMQDTYSGTDNAGKNWLIGPGMKFKPNQRSPLEMDYMNTRNRTREEIAGVFGVPLPLIGVMEHATMNNLEQYKKLLWENAIIPKLDEFKNTINADFRSEYNGEVTLDYDISHISILKDDKTTDIDNALKLRKLGFSLAEINEKLELGFKDVPENAPIPQPDHLIVKPDNGSLI